MLRAPAGAVSPRARPHHSDLPDGAKPNRDCRARPAERSSPSKASGESTNGRPANERVGKRRAGSGSRESNPCRKPGKNSPKQNSSGKTNPIFARYRRAASVASRRKREGETAGHRWREHQSPRSSDTSCGVRDLTFLELKLHALHETRRGVVGGVGFGSNGTEIPGFQPRCRASPSDIRRFVFKASG